MQALSTVGYDGFLTFEYFHPYEHYPEALVFQTSDSMDRMLRDLVLKASHVPPGCDAA